MFAHAQRRQQRLHHPAYQIVVQFQQLSHRGLGRLGPQQRSARHFHQLRRQPQLLANWQERSGQNHVDFGLFPDPLEIGCLADIPRSCQRRPHDQVFQPRQGYTDGFRQTVTQKLDLLARSQQPERKDDQAPQRLCARLRIDSLQQ
jgi:hypothetical protein